MPTMLWILVFSSSVMAASRLIARNRTLTVFLVASPYRKAVLRNVDTNNSTHHRTPYRGVKRRVSNSISYLT